MVATGILSLGGFQFSVSVFNSQPNLSQIAADSLFSQALRTVSGLFSAVICGDTVEAARRQKPVTAGKRKREVVVCQALEIGVE